MTLDLRTIWTSTNKVLTTINLYILAFIMGSMSGPVKVKDPDETKIPFLYNILLLAVLSSVLYFLIYIFFIRPSKG